MSEKRFRANFDVSIYDSEKEEYISVSERGLEEIAKRMNELQDKKTELEKELTDCKNRKEQCNHKKAILDFLKFMKMDNPLMEIMIDEFLEEIYDGDV